MGGADRPASSLEFRADIAGLRAIAVTAVVLYHAGVAQLPGGFAGVDVFFVISGFLITSLLLRELEASGTIHLGRFWARRIRRLVPAAALMIAVTAAATLLLVSPLNFRETMTNAVASILYVSNFHFALSGSDYFAEDLNVPNPFLHTWTLGVEEQFYIVLPLVLLGVWFIARRRGLQAARLMTAVALGVVFAASLALSVVLTPAQPDVAFYLLPTRM